MTSTSSRSPFPEDRYYRDLKRRHLVRLFVSYIAPIVLLSVFFYFQYEDLAETSRDAHLRAIADNRTSTLDLYLTERLVNLSNAFGDPRFPIPPTSQEIAGTLAKLQATSSAFVDVGYFDASGVQTVYAGPYPALANRSYSEEAWYRSLKDSTRGHVITDIYLGFRQRPHFTIAVSKYVDGDMVVLRSTLDPHRIYEYIQPPEDSLEVRTSIVNGSGLFQLVSPEIGSPLQQSPILPPERPRSGVACAEVNGQRVPYAYGWLHEADWVLIVQPTERNGGGALGGFRVPFVSIATLLVMVLTIIIYNRAGSIITAQRESDRTRAQLEHAAKLASVGELAAGIAHEINNPLASISEEAGLTKDLLSPEFGGKLSNEEIIARLESIQRSVFRCRDITSKLLKFVRKTDVDLREHDIHEIIDDVVDGFLGPEFAVSKIAMVKEYDPESPRVLTDEHQLEQVLLNLVNNAVDAIGNAGGTITIRTSHDNGTIAISVTDTGCGMTDEQLHHIFMPFFTTKDVGKGTGLGLSVSYGIMKSLGGRIEVESESGKGSTFTLIHPVRGPQGADRSAREHLWLK